MVVLALQVPAGITAITLACFLRTKVYIMKVLRVYRANEYFEGIYILAS